MKIITMLTIIILAVSGCTNENNKVILDQTYNLNYKEVKLFPDQQSAILLDSVLNDSRCPLQAECVWVGNAAVRFIYKKDNVNRPLILNTLSSFRTDTLIEGVRIKMISLNPYPQIGNMPIKQKDYQAEIQITKEN